MQIREAEAYIVLNVVKQYRYDMTNPTRYEKLVEDY